MNVWITIVLSGIATYATRVPPLVITLRGPAPTMLRRYLDALPTAVIAAWPSVLGPGPIATGTTRAAAVSTAVAAEPAAVVPAWPSVLEPATVTTGTARPTAISTTVAVVTVAEPAACTVVTPKTATARGGPTVATIETSRGPTGVAIAPVALWTAAVL